MLNVNIISSFFGTDGYSNNARQFSNHLNKLDNIDVSITTNLPEDWLRRVNDEELKMIQRNRLDADVNLLISTPPSWEYYLCEDKKFIGMVVHEGDRIPKGWLNILEDERVTQIWVPSMHTKNAILNTLNQTIKGVEHKGESFCFHPDIADKIKIVPHGVDLSIFEEQPKEASDKFTFMMNKGWPSSWKDRGGISYGIKAFMEEFTKEDNAEMLVKINACYGVDLDKNIKDLDIQNTNKPKLNIVTDNITLSQLSTLYNKSDVFVTTSLAESFNLPPLEAMACGKPVLATEYGGQSDFVTEENGWLLKEGEMKEVKWDIMYEDISWKYPSIKEIRKQMRYIYDNKNEVIEKSKIAIEDSKRWTWNNSAIKAKECLLELKIN